MRGEFGVGAVSARCGLRSEMRADAGHFNTCSRALAPGQHTQPENTKTQDKEDKTLAQCEVPLRCVQCEQHAS